MGFYTYPQNNSGGYFIRNEDVSDYLIVEAPSLDEADTKKYEITEDYSDWCECCGERWGSFWGSDGTDKPTVHGREAEKENCVVHYSDGRKEVHTK